MRQQFPRREGHWWGICADTMLGIKDTRWKYDGVRRDYTSRRRHSFGIHAENVLGVRGHSLGIYAETVLGLRETH